MGLVNKLKAKMSGYQNLSIVAKATLWFLICSVIQKCLSIITTPIFTRLLTVEQYGQVTIFNSWLQIVTIICTLRLDYGVFYKGMSKYEDDRDGYTVSMQSFSTLLVIGVTFIYLIFHSLINSFTELSTPITLVMLCEILAASAVSYWSVRNRYEYNYKKIVAVTLLLSVFNVLVSLVAVQLTDEKGAARIVSAALVEIIIGLAIYITNIKKAKKLIKWEYVKYAVLFNIPLLPHYFSTYILDQSDRIMIQKLIGIEEAAVYGVAYNCAIVIKIVSNSINNALVPWEYSKLKERNFRDLNKNLNKFMILFSAAALVFIALAPEVIYILAGENYMEAVYCIPPVTTSCFFLFVFGLYGNAEFHYDANKFTMYISIAGAVLNLILNFIFINIFGYIAAAYTTLFCYMLFTFAHFIFANALSMKHDGGRAFDYKCLILCSVVLCIGVFVMSLLYSHIIVRYAVIVVILLVALIKRKEIMKMLKLK